MVCYILQSSICVKQLGYGILELLLISVFPELRTLLVDVHEKMSTPQSQSV
jgi:sorting nexin-13